jgi:hypothetical protein
MPGADPWEIFPNNPFQVIWARAYARAGAYGGYAEEFGGYDPNNGQWLAGANVSAQIPYLSPQPMVHKLLFGAKERYGKGRLQVGNTIFDKATRTVRLVNIQGNLAVKTFDKANDFATFTISVTKIDSLNADDFSDATYKKQVIWSSKAMIHNGRLLLQGKFGFKNFTIADQNDESSVQLNMQEMVIQLPTNVDMDNISVNVGVDNGNYGLGVSEKFKMSEEARVHQIAESYTAEEEFTFSNYPNPVTDKFTVTVKLPATQNVELGVYDGSGTLLKSLYKGQAVKDKALQVQSDLSGLKRDVYYLKLTTADKVLARKLILR